MSALLLQAQALARRARLVVGRLLERRTRLQRFAHNYPELVPSYGEPA